MTYQENWKKHQENKETFSNFMMYATLIFAVIGVGATLALAVYVLTLITGG